MAADIIDALVVTLNLDAGKYQEGQVQARRQLDQTRESEKKRTQEALAGSKEMQRAAESVVQAYQKVRNEILGLFGVLLAGRGLKAFVSDIVQGDAAAGYMARSLGIATEELAAWQQVAEKSGGTAAGITGAFAKLSNTIANFTQLGIVDQNFNSGLARLNISLVDPTTNKLKSLSELLKEIAVPLSSMTAPNANVIGGLLGLDPQTVAVLRQNGGGRPALERQLAQARQNGVPTDEDIKKEQQLLNILYDMKKIVESIGRETLLLVDPDIEKHLVEFNNYLIAHRPEWTQEFKSVYDAAGQVTGEIDKIFKTITGLNSATEDFFLLWTGTKFISMMTGLSTLSLGLIGIVGLLSYLNIKNPQTQMGEGAYPYDPSKGPEQTHESGWKGLWNRFFGGNKTQIPPEGRALLDAIAPGESNGTYAAQPSSTGAFGRYQFLSSTWEEVSKQTGLTDPTPENQDMNAWFYAQQMYRRNTGKDLSADLKAGIDVSPGLNKIWTSLPGGPEENAATPGFQTRLKAFLRQQQDSIQDPAALSRGVNATPGPQSMRVPSPWDNIQATPQVASAANTNVTIGDVTINTQAKDAAGIARDIKTAIQRQLFTSQLNSGLV